MRNRRLTRLLTLCALYGIPALILGWYGFHRYLNSQIYAAVRNHDTNEVRRLLALGADPNLRWSPVSIPNIYKSSLLEISVGSSSTDEIPIALIDAGARTNITMPGGRTFLQTVIDNGHPELARKLLDREPSAIKTVTVPPPYSGMGRSHEMYELLRDRGAKVSLADAINYKDTKLARSLIASGADPNGVVEQGVTVLMLACGSGDVDLVGAFLDKGARIDARENQGNTALMFAVQQSRPDIARLLLARGASIKVRNRQGYTVLMNAVASGRSEIVRDLLDRGADPNIHATVKEMNGGTFVVSAVSLAAQTRTPIYDMLKKHGAKVTFPEALQNRDRALVLDMLRAGAISNRITRERKPSLLGAIGMGDKEIAAELLCAGARIDEPDYAGWTPLMHCIFNNNSEMGEFLIQRGADLYVKGKDGTPVLNWFSHFPKYKQTIERLKLCQPATKVAATRSFP